MATVRHASAIHARQPGVPIEVDALQTTVGALDATKLSLSDATALAHSFVGKMARNRPSRHQTSISSSRRSDVVPRIVMAAHRTRGERRAR
jgi:hypothetical protein